MLPVGRKGPCSQIKFASYTMCLASISNKGVSTEAVLTNRNTHQLAKNADESPKAMLRNVFLSSYPWSVAICMSSMMPLKFVAVDRYHLPDELADGAKVVYIEGYESSVS